MTTQPTTPKRWRPRFSVRTLVVLVTVVCCYAACWGPTKRQGVIDALRCEIDLTDKNYESEWLTDENNELVEPFLQLFDAKATMPLVVGVTPSIRQRRRRYYFWFFGYVAKLPYERDVP